MKWKKVGKGKRSCQTRRGLNTEVVAPKTAIDVVELIHNKQTKSNSK